MREAGRGEGIGEVVLSPRQRTRPDEGLLSPRQCTRPEESTAGMFRFTGERRMRAGRSCGGRQRGGTGGGERREGESTGRKTGGATCRAERHRVHDRVMGRPLQSKCRALPPSPRPMQPLYVTAWPPCGCMDYMGDRVMRSVVRTAPMRPPRPQCLLRPHARRSSLTHLRVIGRQGDAQCGAQPLGRQLDG